MLGFVNVFLLKGRFLRNGAFHNGVDILGMQLRLIRAWKGMAKSLHSSSAFMVRK